MFNSKVEEDERLGREIAKLILEAKLREAGWKDIYTTFRENEYEPIDVDIEAYKDDGSETAMNIEVKVRDKYYDEWMLEEKKIERMLIDCDRGKSNEDTLYYLSICTVNTTAYLYKVNSEIIKQFNKTLILCPKTSFAYNGYELKPSYLLPAERANRIIKFNKALLNL